MFNRKCSISLTASYQIQCETTGTRNRFRKCGGCEERIYCSEKCQRDAWKFQGHRKLCGHIAIETGELTTYAIKRISFTERVYVTRASYTSQR